SINTSNAPSRPLAGSITRPPFNSSFISPLHLIRGASPLGLPHTLSRSPLRRLAPFAWLASQRSLASFSVVPARHGSLLVHRLRRRAFPAAPAHCHPSPMAHFPFPMAPSTQRRRPADTTRPFAPRRRWRPVRESRNTDR